MIKAHGFATQGPKEKLGPYQFERRELRERDVVIEIQYCGVCHSDIHQARDEWGGSKYPMVPGHEIVGKVTRVGPGVKRFKVGDLAGVGCLVDSCRDCASCRSGLEQFCEKGWVGTYNSLERDGKTLTQGGYSDSIVVDEAFTLKIPAGMDLARAAPLLCAGITTYSPMRHWKVSAGQNVGIVGLGWLGHMGVKIARALGANVTVFTTSKGKIEDARRLGAHHVVLSKDATQMEAVARSFDFLLDTVSATHALDPYLGLLKRDGKLVMVGLPTEAPTVEPGYLIMKRLSVAGSLIGGLAETQEMLDFCAKHEIACDIELVPIQKINEAYERTIKSDVKYRFVIDMKSLKA